MSLRILSASRRTDIPAFYGEWFMNRVRAGWWAVPNPFNSKQISRLEWIPGETLIVFWTRWPAPFMRHLDELERRGLRFYFLCTLVDYPRPLEPRAPRRANRLAAFLRLAERIGPERVIWRYDPIVLGAALDADFHRERFARIGQCLRGATRRVVIAVADDYAKSRARLRELARAHPELAPRAFEPERDGALIRDLAGMARALGCEIQSCGATIDMRPWGVAAGKCIDDGLIRRLFGLQAPARKDGSQRPACACIESRDIGMYDSCPCGCVYCYATRDGAAARRNHARHDPTAESLIGGYRAPPPTPAQGDLFG